MKRRIFILATSLLALTLGLRFLPQPAAMAQAVNHYVNATFHPSATAAGIAVECTTLPSSPANGDVACDSGASNVVKVYSNGAWVTVGAGSAPAAGDSISVSGSTVSLTPFDWNSVVIKDDLCLQISSGDLGDQFGRLNWHVISSTASYTAALGADIHSPCKRTLTSNASANAILRYRTVAQTAGGSGFVNPTTQANWEIRALVELPSTTSVGFQFYMSRYDRGSNQDCFAGAGGGTGTSPLDCFGITFDSLDASDTTFVARNCNGASCTTSTTSSPTVAANTRYILRIWMSVAGTVHMSVDGTEIGTGFSVTPNFNYAPAIGVRGNAKAFVWRGFGLLLNSLGN